MRGLIPALDALFCPQQDFDGHASSERGSTTDVTRRAWRITLDLSIARWLEEMPPWRSYVIFVSAEDDRTA
ncbi:MULTISPECIES: hypothetical protein [Polyangium]|uniref:Uncharacterized protein n=2 Tax=Polyangium TaxID=55 RepID=A0A4U1J234_9BACT|nr:MULTISPECIES: hypothetical protein [Polyangium]MDI1437371.1 hypothetical protein [Polyangium sorediatum]TKD01029.1 hypothetical protein E8A74_32195 [Polyangium fumosum]